MTPEHPSVVLIRDIAATAVLTRDHLARAWAIAGIVQPMNLAPGETARKRRTLTPRQAAKEPAPLADILAFASTVLPEAELADWGGGPPYQVDMRHQDRFAYVNDRPEPDWFKFSARHKTSVEAAIMLVLLEAEAFWHPT